MNNQHIIFVPGKNPKPPPEQHRDLLWRCLIEGVRRAQPDIARDLGHHENAFHLTAWNHSYYHVTRDIGYVLPWIDELMYKHGPSQEDIKQANALKVKISRLLYTIADHFPPLIKMLPEPARRTIEETNRYFKNRKNIGYEIRGQLKQYLRPVLDKGEPVIIIGHSLGSIIAYDTLWELSHNESHSGKIDLFTIGSPLGLNFVQNKLQGRQFQGKHKYPTNIRRWINLSSVGDITALDRCFKDDFGSMLELGIIDSIEDHCDGIYNFFRDEEGLNCHRSYGYLVNPAVGEIIAEWWQQNRQQ
jgi:hypothetical protein